MQIYVLINNEQQGPFSVSQIKGYLAMGHFQHTDLAWHEGLPEWKPLEQFPDFAPKEHRTPNYKSVPVRQVSKQRAKGSQGALAAAVLVVALAAAGAGFYFYYWKPRQQKAAEAKAAAEAAAQAKSAEVAAVAALPKTLEELNRWYEEPPAGQNAAVLFQQGFDALQITNADKSSSSLPLIGRAPMPVPGVPVSAGMRNALKTFLERNQPALDLFGRGAQCSGSRYPIDLTKVEETSPPHVAKLKLAAQVAELDALFQADAKLGAGAATAVLIAHTAARTLEAEPLLVSQLVRSANESAAVEALEQTLNRVTPPADSLAQLQSAFDHAAEYDAAGTGYNRAYLGQRVSLAALFDSPPEQLKELVSHQAPALAKSPQLDKILGNLKEQRQFTDDTFNQAMNIRKEPFPGRLRADEVFGQRIEEAKAKGHTLFILLASAFGKPTGREAVGLAHLRLAQTAIALEKFRAANGGQYPASLNELAPKFLSAVPADPFDGQPLRYRKAVEGYALYSVGPDLRDDGGVRKLGSDDLVFNVVKAPRQ